VVLAQQCFTKDKGWPVPSKFAHLYENLLEHCPYRQFFDTESLCHSDNEKNVSKLLEKTGQEAVDYFNATFRGSNRIGQRNEIIKLLLCVKNFVKKNKSLFSTHLKISS
jgi:hypothetical protein